MVCTNPEYNKTSLEDRSFDTHNTHVAYTSSSPSSSSIRQHFRFFSWHNPFPMHALRRKFSPNSHHLLPFLLLLPFTTATRTLMTIRNKLCVGHHTPGCNVYAGSVRAAPLRARLNTVDTQSIARSRARTLVQHAARINVWKKNVGC